MFGQIPAASLVKSSSPRTSPLLSSNSSASEQPAETPTDRISNLSPDSRGFSPSVVTNSRGFSPSAVTNSRGFSPSAVIKSHRRESAFISFNHMSPFGRGGVMADIPPSNLSIYPSLYQQTSEPIIDQNLWQKLAHVGLIQPSSQAILSNGAWKQDISPHPYRPNGLSGPYIDSSLRSKNGSRESTGTLKAWLCEHMKNPYPSKGEKIMLAIITKMTLTQVSTWFANARRRLKKESIVNWNDDDDDDEGLDDEADNNNDKRDAGDEGDGRQGSWKIETGDSESSRTRPSRDFRQTSTHESNEIDDSNAKRRKNTSPVKHMTDPFVRIPSPSTSPVSPSSSSLSSNEFSSPHSSTWKNRFSKCKDDWETPAEHRIVSRFNNNNNDDVNDDVRDVDDDDDDVRSVKSLAIDMTTSRSSVSNSADSGVPQHGEVRRPRIWSIAEIIAR